MSGVASGVGIISGIPIADLVRQLMALEARPMNLLKARAEQATNVKTAYTELSARFLSAKAAASRLAKADAFTVRNTSSSNEDVLTATATSSTPLDTYSFTVHNLVTTHQVVSAGFTGRDVPIGAGALTFEIGQGNTAPATLLSDLNGGSGVRRGVIRITDRSGAKTDIDLRTATDLNEVLDAINGQADVRVKASIQGDRLVLTDQTGLSTGSLTVSDLAGGFTAADLGIAGSGAGQIVSTDLVRLADATLLSRLNDGNGVRVQGVTDDVQFTLHDGRQINVNLSGVLRFGTRLEEVNDGRGVRLGIVRLTNRAGQTANVDLSSAATVQDVVTAINGSGLSITASLTGSRINLSDTSGGTTSNFKIEDVSGYAAADLGIKGDVAATSLVGAAIYRVNTVGAVLRAIQYATGNEDGALSAAISSGGDGLVFTDSSTGGGATSVTALTGSNAARDLGLLGDFSTGTLSTGRLRAGLNTVLLSSLNGGSGVNTSSLSIDRSVGGAGSTANIDVSSAQSLQDVIDAINAYEVSGSKVFQASVATGGTGIVINDIGGGTITAVGGTAATDLHLSTTQTGGIAGGDLNLRYISENTQLSTLNGGRGVAASKFRITNSNGVVTNISLAASQKTIGDVIKAINSANGGVTASINSKGDGILLTDTAGGALKLKVTEDGGTAAADLNLLGTATSTTIDGSFGRTVDVSGSDTLDSLASKINAANVGVRASIVNDGSAVAPYRLILSSATTGAGGRVNFSTGSTGLSLATLSEGRDAKVVIGSIDSPSSIVLTSSSNTVKNVVDGLTLQLHATSDEPVDLTVDRDVDQVVEDVKTLVKTFNDALDRIKEFTKFVPETQEKGILLGDSIVEQVRVRIFNLVSGRARNDELSFTRLSEVGLTLGGGAHLQFDEDKFREAFGSDPEGVQKLFTLTSTDPDTKKVTRTGFAARLEAEIDALTQSGSGLLSRQADQTQERIDLFNKRAMEMQLILNKREQRLLAQFQAMERSLAALQGQQASLGALSSLAASFSASSGLSSLGSLGG